ncbi:hypothetical protein KM043_000032 [Ampulex compressa]|nr:hypothetical protein KM043_000032 [Ampulex compressa]
MANVKGLVPEKAMAHVLVTGAIVDDLVLNVQVATMNLIKMKIRQLYVYSIDCDKACDGCTGDGPDMCLKCADGYHKQNNLCINSDFLGRKKHINIARYVTYLGLCVATCIIFQRNIYAASVIGLAVGIYISVSEYMIAHNDVQDTMASVDVLGSA